MDDRIKTMLDLFKHLEALKEKEAASIATLDTLQKEIKRTEETLIPDIMQSIGITEFKTPSGAHVKLKTDVFANISKEREAQAFAYLREKNMTGIIKSKIEVDAAYEDTLEENDVTFVKKESVHPSTLKSFVKERLEADPQFPRELFGVHEAVKAVLTHSS